MFLRAGMYTGEDVLQACFRAFFLLENVQHFRNNISNIWGGIAGQKYVSHGP